MATDFSIGRMQNALMSATSEFTVAGANINFEFTMVKYEAPVEYQPLSRSLSTNRRKEAEGGEIHITARRLGALFEGVCPSTQNLIKAYGTRASEIAEQASARESLDASSWIFSAYAGIDATSIWAAATSRKAALPVHLLACMLARLWDDAEAVSLWVEIVAERRSEITARFADGDEMPFGQTAAAMQPEISREQLAKWDASARAWLRTADSVQMRQYKQFLLVIKNISIPVNGEATTYQSIMSAWISSLETMEGLLLGRPHVVRDGAVLLALSAWHLYPDMVVFGGTRTTEVFMNDPLVHSGGVLSLGVSDSDERQSKGVYWSLSLAHHKFYGRPILKTAGINTDGSRITFLELQQAVIGVILAHWNIPLGETNEALKFLLQITAFLDHDPASLADLWIEMIKTPILEYFKDEELGSSLLALGRRRRAFIKPPKTGPERPFFGLTQMNNLISLVTTTDDRVELLRRLARRVRGLDEVGTVIAVKEGKTWIYTTAFPIPVNQRCPFDKNQSGTTDNTSTKQPQSHCRWVPRSARVPKVSASERVVRFGNKEFDRQRTLFRKPQTGQIFEFFFGDADIAAVFREQDVSSFAPISLPALEHDDVRWCFQHELLSSHGIRDAIFSATSPTICVLLYLAFASRLYSNLTGEGATISTSILSCPFVIHHLGRKLAHGGHDDTGGFFLSPGLTVAAAVIVYFETGRDLVGASSLSSSQILGLSVGDSIYVPTKMLQDPSIRSTSLFSRLLGNLGRPGLTILTSPMAPDCRDVNTSAWKKSSVPFDGSPEDYFNRTTLHLSLTDWKAPLQESRSVGQRDFDGTHLEAVVSVRDSGSWVADINPVSALQDAGVLVLSGQESSCHHTTPQHPSPEFQALETWDQILDCPEGILVTKSHNNWVARLALISVLAQHCKLSPKRIVICPASVCWQCVDKSVRNTVFVY